MPRLQRVRDDHKDSRTIKPSIHILSLFPGRPAATGSGAAGKLLPIRYLLCDGHGNLVTLEAMPGQEQFPARVRNAALRDAEPLDRVLPIKRLPRQNPVCGRYRAGIRPSFDGTPAACYSPGSVRFQTALPRRAFRSPQANA